LLTDTCLVQQWVADGVQSASTSTAGWKQMSVQFLGTSHMVGTARTGIWLAHQEPEIIYTPSSNSQGGILTSMVILYIQNHVSQWWAVWQDCTFRTPLNTTCTILLTYLQQITHSWL
jgi:hypothetical protein